MAVIEQMIYGSNLVPGVVPKLNYRSDIVQNIPRWIVTAIRYITDNYPFEELSKPGPIFRLTFGQPTYSISNFVYENTNNITRFDSFILYISPFVGIGVSSPAIELKWRGIKVVKQLSQIISMPIIYTIYGTSPTIGGTQQVLIAMAPSNNWQVQASYQMKHPFVDGINDVIMLPDSWLEVVANVAALIGAEENRMVDTMQTLKAVLYGDPSDPRKPGLINALVSSRSQFSNVNERQLNMISEL